MAQSELLLMGSDTKMYSHVGQSSKERFYRSIHLSFISTSEGNLKMSPQSMFLQHAYMGSSDSINTYLRSSSSKYYSYYRNMASPRFQKSNSKSHLEIATWVRGMENLERKELKDIQD
jgi:hypothetical protein